MVTQGAKKALQNLKPLLDRIGARNVNIFLFLLYLAFWGWGFAGFLFIPSNPNIDWPISHALAYGIVFPLSHFLIIGIGATLVPDYVYYPVEPKWVYMIADGVIFFVLVGIVASYILDPISSTVPLVGMYVLLIMLLINLWKLYSLVWGSARPKQQKEALISA